MQSATPDSLLIPVWPLSLSLATTHKISVDFSSSPYLDVSVQEVPLIYLFIQYMIYKLLLYGLLHSEICGSQFAYNLPQLIAVNHVLLRFPMPRHPPCALFSFTICFSWVLLKYIVVLFTRLQFFLLKNRVVSLDCISSYFDIQFSRYFYSPTNLINWMFFHYHSIYTNQFSIDFDRKSFYSYFKNRN